MKKEQWAKYRKAKIAMVGASDRASDAFGELFKEGDEIKYRRKVGGNVLTGRIYLVDTRFRQVKVENLQTRAKYWVGSYWIVESENQGQG